jgi:membrane protein YdbS with pleckstrin-like domain
MKQQQPRETAPLWVWLAIALMLIIAIAYLTGYWMVGEIISHKK